MPTKHNLHYKDVPCIDYKPIYLKVNKTNHKTYPSWSLRKKEKSRLSSYEVQRDRVAISFQYIKIQ